MMNFRPYHWFVVAALCLGGAVALVAGAEEGEDEKWEALERLFAAYDSKVVRDVSQLERLRSDVDAAIMERTTALLKVREEDFPSYGEGDIVVYKFSDYQCPYCQQTSDILKKYAERNRIKVFLIDFPVLGAVSERATRYAYAAWREGANFSDLHFSLMALGRGLSEDSIRTVIEDGGRQKISSWLPLRTGRRLRRRIEENFQLASLLKVRGVPAMVIKGRVVRGALPEEDFVRLLEE